VKALVAYRLLAPGSEWRLHREWFQRSALADLPGEDAGLAEIHKLCRRARPPRLHRSNQFRNRLSPGGTRIRTLDPPVPMITGRRAAAGSASPRTRPKHWRRRWPSGRRSG
jgi:hypothetical protein